MFNRLKTALENFFATVYAVKVPFFILFFIVVLLTYAVLYAADFYPEPLSEETKEARLKAKAEKALQREIMVMKEKEQIASATPSTSADTSIESTTEKVEPKSEVAIAVSAILPTRIVIESLGVDVKVLNPETRDVAALDSALLSGVVRHPDSANLGKAGNMLILGHSSYLPNVMNKNFQAFNGIQKMTWGDTIHVYADGTKYTYRVQKVYQAKASDVTIMPTPGKAMLTLATCNSFGSKEDRYIVEATLLESQ